VNIHSLAPATGFGLPLQLAKLGYECFSSNGPIASPLYVLRDKARSALQNEPHDDYILLGVEPQYRVFSLVRSRNNHTSSRTPTPVQVASFKANYLRLAMRLVAGQ
jgi:hypothetical protein